MARFKNINLKEIDHDMFMIKLSLQEITEKLSEDDAIKLIKRDRAKIIKRMERIKKNFYYLGRGEIR